MVINCDGDAVKIEHYEKVGVVDASLASSHHGLKRDFETGGADELQTPVPIVVVEFAKLAMTLFQVGVVFPIDDHSHIVLARDPRLDRYFFGQPVLVVWLFVVITQSQQ